MSEIYLAYKQTATRPAHRPSGGRRRRELGRPPWLSSACCTSPCRARGGAPRRLRGELGQPPEHSPSSRLRRGDAFHASPCLAERRHEKAAGAQPAAMSERSRSSRLRRRLPCVPAFGRAGEVNDSMSSAGRNGRELLDTPVSGRATASSATGAVCEAARWVDLPWVKRIPAAHTTVPWLRGSPATPHRRRRG
jgi:hypothetical protein